MNTVKIGWAKREVSIDEPVSIPGQMYLRVSEGIHDPLYVTALCVDGGEGQDAVVFLSCDVGSLGGGIIGATCDLVARMRPEIPVDAIILNATHTHSSVTNGPTPETTPDGKPIYSGEKYREFFARQCAEAICEAWDKRAQGGIAFGYGYAVVAHSRRVVYLDDVSLRQPADKPSVAPNGHGVMYGNTNDDQFSHYEAGSDAFLNAMFTFDAEEKLTGIVVNVPCPSQLSEHFTKLSADFWNEVRVNIAKAFGEDVYVLPQCAAAGDLSPRVLHYKGAQARRMELKYGLPYDPNKAMMTNYNKIMGERYDIAQRILESVREIYSWAKKDIQSRIPVRHLRRDVELARRMITEEEKIWCEENIEKMRLQIPDPAESTPEACRKAITTYNSIKRRNSAAVARFESQKTNPTFPTVLHTVQIGEIAFATNRFELYMDYMHRMQARSPFIQTFVVQLAGAEGASYLATQRGAQDKGYSASLFCNQVSYEGGQQIVEATLDMLGQMKARDAEEC